MGKLSHELLNYYKDGFSGKTELDDASFYHHSGKKLIEHIDALNAELETAKNDIKEILGCIDQKDQCNYCKRSDKCGCDFENCNPEWRGIKD